MILQASNGCYLTENFEVDIKVRRFVKSIIVASQEEAAMWKEITEIERDQMIEEGKIFAPKSVDYTYLNKVDALLAGVSDKINEVELTTEQKLEKKSYFPKWNDLIGESAEPEFNFQHGDDLFEVLQLHTFSAEWVPGEAGTESLYKKVSLHEGSKEDPIPWEPNMQLYQGKYYTEAEVLYLCTRDSGIPLNYSLAELVDQYVAVVNEEEPEDPAEADGSKENPIPYEYAKTVLVNGKYYTQDGVKYLCKRDAGMPLSYNLADLVSAGYVDLINE